MSKFTEQENSITTFRDMSRPRIDVDHADHPVIAAGIVVDARVQEFHPTPAEAVFGLPADRILADVDGLLRGEAGRAIGTTVVIQTVAVTTVAVAFCRGLDLRGAQLAVVEVHRAGEAEAFLPATGPRRTSIMPTTQSLRPGLSSTRVLRNSTARLPKRSPACLRHLRTLFWYDR